MSKISCSISAMCVDNRLSSDNFLMRIVWFSSLFLTSALLSKKTYPTHLSAVTTTTVILPLFSLLPLLVPFKFYSVVEGVEREEDKNKKGISKFSKTVLSFFLIVVLCFVYTDFKLKLFHVVLLDLFDTSYHDLHSDRQLFQFDRSQHGQSSMTKLLFVHSDRRQSRTGLMSPTLSLMSSSMK